MGALLNGTQRDITDFAAPPLNKLKWSESLHVRSTDDLHGLVCECEEVTAPKVEGPMISNQRIGRVQAMTLKFRFAVEASPPFLQL